MDQVIEFFRGLFATNLWPARWHCGHWTDFHGWLYIISDLMIWSAYFAMPIIIVGYISKKKGTKFLNIYFLFAAFILFCGATHLLDAITFWYPMYRFNALVRFFTGIISWITVFYLIKMIPVAFALKSPELLEAEVEQRKRAEEELRASLKQLNNAQEIARMGHWEWDMVTDTLIWSDALFRLYGVPKSEGALSYEKFLSIIHPDDRANVEEIIKDSAANKSFKSYYHRIIMPDGQIKTIYARGEIITDASGNVIKMIGTGQDVTDQKRTELELIIKSSNLEAANAELQKFAYVASHDLQEPLRKINTFGTRLEAEFGDVLPEKGQTYLGKMTGASVRMQKLISDVLNFSQLTSAALAYEKIDLTDVLQQVLSDMEITIETTRAKIEASTLPVIEANPTQIRQLFQNLLTNSIKFKKDNENPLINISADIITGDQLENAALIKMHYRFAGWNEDRYWKKEKFCRLVFRDHGIGFAPQYAERIFVVFQRLHTDTSHEGTGIGLAICKKIADNHHGMISAVGTENEGATFTITLPLSQANFTSTAIS
jgi:PAS domain S-box-containing protein